MKKNTKKIILAMPLAILLLWTLAYIAIVPDAERFWHYGFDPSIKITYTGGVHTIDPKLEPIPELNKDNGCRIVMNSPSYHVIAFDFRTGRIDTLFKNEIYSAQSVSFDGKSALTGSTGSPKASGYFREPENDALYGGITIKSYAAHRSGKNYIDWGEQGSFAFFLNDTTICSSGTDSACSLIIGDSVIHIPGAVRFLPPFKLPGLSLSDFGVIFEDSTSALNYVKLDKDGKLETYLLPNNFYSFVNDSEVMCMDKPSRKLVNVTIENIYTKNKRTESFDANLVVPLGKGFWLVQRYFPYKDIYFRKRNCTGEYIVTPNGKCYIIQFDADVSCSNKYSSAIIAPDLSAIAYYKMNRFSNVLYVITREKVIKLSCDDAGEFVGWVKK